MNSRILVTALLSTACIIAVLLLIIGLKPGWISSAMDSVDQWITPQTTYGESLTTEVKRVIDGDTILLANNDTVRLLNIDTPETVKPESPVECYGPEASAYNKSLELEEYIVLKFDKEKRDQYGRLLAFVFPAKVDTNLIENSYNAQLVKHGFARSYIIPPNTSYAKLFQKLEREARDANIGAWGACPAPFQQ